VSPLRFLLDTSALVRLLRQAPVRARWEEQITAGIVGICPITELEMLHTARSKADRDELVDLLSAAFCWIPMPDRAFSRATEVQAELTSRGTHRSAGPVDLLVAAAAELNSLVLVHYDHDFDRIAEVTGQGMSRLASAGSID
jgi:predicted nucleic acid-binding protein